MYTPRMRSSKLDNGKRTHEFYDFQARIDADGSNADKASVGKESLEDPQQ